MKRLIFIAAAAALLTGPPAARAQRQQPLYGADKPTAGVLENRTYLVRGRTGPESSFLVDVRLGLGNRFQFGASFGMQRLFERGSVEFNDRLGINARFRVMEEGATPAVAIGFDSQGRGIYHNDLGRYDRKSPGIYAVVSKNYALLLGELSLHGGGSWSTEDEDDHDPNIFGVADWLLFERLSFLLDVDAALNDNTEGSSFGQGGVYIDAAVRWFYRDHLVITLAFTDLTGNFGTSNRVGRELDIALVNSF